VQTTNGDKPMTQRSNETQDEYIARLRNDAERIQERAHRLHEFAAEPKDLFSDIVTFHENHGVLRMTFHATRPESAEIYGMPYIPVARVSFPFGMFKQYFEAWLQTEAGRDALSEYLPPERRPK
jgi:hypothetical protein